MRFLIIATLVLVGAAGCAPQTEPNEEIWIPLFNGVDMNDWEIKITGRDYNDNYENTFRVEDGVIKVAYDQYDEFSSDFGVLFYHEPFSHYRLAIEYRFVGEQLSGGPGWALRNSGIMIHSQSAESMLTDQDFPISIEVQLLGGTGKGERTTANLCTPGTHVEMDGELVTTHCINSTSKTYHGEQWVRVEILVLGSERISHVIDGMTVLEYEKPQIGGGAVDPFDPAIKADGTLLGNGYIALQSESHPIEFRLVELLNLKGCTDSDASNYKTYFVESDESTCSYD